MYATAHDYALIAPAPEEVGEVISRVMDRHAAELNAALEPYGVQLGDLLRPTWMRAVYVEDVRPFNSPGFERTGGGAENEAPEALQGAATVAGEGGELSAEERAAARSLFAPRPSCGERCGGNFCGGCPPEPDEGCGDGCCGPVVNDSEACSPEFCDDTCSMRRADGCSGSAPAEGGF